MNKASFTKGGGARSATEDCGSTYYNYGKHITSAYQSVFRRRVSPCLLVYICYSNTAKNDAKTTVSSPATAMDKLLMAP